MAKQRGRYEFTVQVDGKTYNCVREVQGVRLLGAPGVLGGGTRADGARPARLRVRIDKDTAAGCPRIG